MLNLFVNSTTFGQAIGVTFEMEQAPTCSLRDRRITPDANLAVQAPVQARALSTEKVQELIAKGMSKKIAGLSKSLEVECIRVASLGVLYRELAMIDAIATEHADKIADECMIAYVPDALLKELETGRVKFYLNGRAETSYYSADELSVWSAIMPLLAKYYDRLVFKDINSCKKNISNTAIQAERVSVYTSMYNKMLVAFKEEQANRNSVTGVTSNYAVEEAF